MTRIEIGLFRTERGKRSTEHGKHSTKNGKKRYDGWNAIDKPMSCRDIISVAPGKRLVGGNATKGFNLLKNFRWCAPNRIKLIILEPF